MGPTVAIGDMNSDGLDDYFIGGAAKQSGSLYFQTGDGFSLQESDVFNIDRAYEDIGATIFDADNDGDMDLYVVSGGYEFEIESDYLKDRLYINTGDGDFKRADASSLPDIKNSGSQVHAADFDKDGDQDLLVLGRQIPGNYPSPSSSVILENISTSDVVKFVEYTKFQPKEFENLGMATSAVLTDYDNDDWLDIIIVGEWMPIRVFRNNRTGFEETTSQLGLSDDMTGWWWSIAEGDFDNDGDMDYVVGNNGLNYKYQANEGETFDIYLKDFDKNKKDDIVLGYYNDGKQYPLRGRECSAQQIPGIKEKFKNYESFSIATLADVYSDAALKDALHYQVRSFASIYLENAGESFIRHELPRAAQLSSINDIIVKDVDTDGFLDIIVAGNLYSSEVETPRNDAGYGLYLKGNGDGRFESISASESGLFIRGDVKDLALIRKKDQDYLLVIKNNDLAESIRID